MTSFIPGGLIAPAITGGVSAGNAPRGERARAALSAGGGQLAGMGAGTLLGLLLSRGGRNGIGPMVLGRALGGGLGAYLGQKSAQ